MKIRMIQLENGKHVVAIDSGAELRCYFRSSSAHTACAVRETLSNDAKRHEMDIGEAANFDGLPVITTRTATTGKTCYSVKGE